MMELNEIGLRSRQVMSKGFRDSILANECSRGFTLKTSQERGPSRSLGDAWEDSAAAMSGSYSWSASGSQAIADGFSIADYIA